MNRTGRPTVQRFALAQRIEHFLLIISFNVLAFTGLPQKYFYTDWAERIIRLMGGIERTRFIHRTFAALLILQSVYHIGAVIAARRAGRQRGTMSLTVADFRGVLLDVAYLAGLRRERPAFGRYDYRQKFEYWAVVWGTAIMATTGLIMWFPEVLTRVVPGVLVPTARVAHGGEAILAIVAVIVWHFYNAHFRPDIFPMDPAMWTGRMDLERLQHEHALEYARMVEAEEYARPPEPVLPDEGPAEGGSPEGAPRKEAPPQAAPPEPSPPEVVPPEPTPPEDASSEEELPTG